MGRVPGPALMVYVMDDNERKINRALEIARAIGDTGSNYRQRDPAPERTHYQKQVERDGWSNWSGASGGGGTWAGRSR